jgi:hypothetical protein
VICEPCPDTLLEAVEVRFKGCYNNAFNFVHENPTARYVIGYALSVIPIEHAWVWYEGTYYDPTWEKYSKLGETYLPLFEYTYLELADILKRNDYCPPAPTDILRLELEKEDT